MLGRLVCPHMGQYLEVGGSGVGFGRGARSCNGLTPKVWMVVNRFRGRYSSSASPLTADIMIAVLALACAVAAVDASGPVIGILAQPGTFCASAAAGTCDPSGPWTWTPEILIASYVKWIEASGARVVPIRSTASAAERASLFASINGLLIPGGDDITLPQWNNAYNNATRD